MKRSLNACGLVVVWLLGVSPALAQSDGGTVAAPAVTAPAASETLPQPVAAGDPLEQLNEVKSQYQALKNARKQEGDRQGLILAVAGFLAALFRFLISSLTKVMKLTQRGKDWIPIATLILGALVMVLTKYTAGMSWLEAIVLGAAGPLSIAADQIIKVYGKKKKTPKTDPETPKTDSEEKTPDA